MDISNKLNLHQGLKTELGLKLTPEMRLRLDVLLATHLELRDILNHELSENPLLDDVVEEDEDESIKQDNDESKEDEDNESEKREDEFTEERLAEAGKKSEAEPGLDKEDEIAGERTEEIRMDKDEAHLSEVNPEDMSNVYDDGESNSAKGIETEYNPEIGKINNPIAAPPEKKNLTEELLSQLNSMHADDEHYQAIYTLISNLDEKGFLPKDIKVISAESGIAEEKLSAAMEILNAFEPVGTGARDARECLLIQLKHKNLMDTLAYKMIDEEFGLVAKQNYTKLAKIFKVKEDDVKKAEEIMKDLLPYPGRDYAATDSEYVSPDIFVVEDEEGKYKVDVRTYFPEIKVNHSFLKQYKENKETKDFIKGYENRVKELAKALYERNKTIDTVVKKILAIQDGFLRNEEEGLKPLTYREIAADVGISESTVSRIVSRKYVQMPYGVFSLKVFFTPEVGGVSNNLLKSKIKNLIDNEDKKNPMTDTEIEKKMKEMGVKQIARRTVTKYREQMGILPANMRKK